MATLATLTVKILGDTGHLVSSLDKARKRSKSFTDSLRKARGPLLAMTGASVALGGAALKAFGDFDQAMTQSLAIMDDVSDTMRNDMVAAAEEVGRVTTFSARDAAESYFFLASAGLDAKESITALPAVAQFAQAGMFEMALATDLLTDAQSALGLKTGDTAQDLENMVRVSDTLVAANAIANASVQQFSEALTNKAGAALRQVGKDIEEGVAVLAAFADQGVKGAEAGTRLGIVMRDLQTKALKNTEEFKKQNIAVFDSSGEMRNFADILLDLEKNLSGASDATRKQTLLTLGFSDKSVSALQTIIGMSSEIRNYEKQLRAAGGTTKKVADKQLTAFNAQMKIARDRTAIAAAHLGAKFAPAMLAVVGVFTTAVEWFSKLDSKTIGLIAGLIGATVAFGALGLMLPPIIVGFGILTGIWGAITTAAVLLAAATWADVAAFIALNAVTGGILITIGAVVAGLIWMSKNWDLTVHAMKVGVNLLITAFEFFFKEVIMFQVNNAIRAFNLLAGVFGKKISLIEIHIKRLDTTYEKTTKSMIENTEELGEAVGAGTDQMSRDYDEMFRNMDSGSTAATESLLEDVKTFADRISEFTDRRLDNEQDALAKILFMSKDAGVTAQELLGKGTKAFIESNDEKLRAFEIYSSGFMTMNEAMVAAQIEGIVEVEERFSEFTDRREKREQETIEKIMFMSQNLAQSQADLAIWGTQFFIDSNADKLAAFEKFSQGFMTIDQAIQAVELAHIEEVGRARLAEMELRIRAEEEFAKLQQRNIEEQARATRIAVGLLPSVIRSNINQGVGAYGGIDPAFFAGFGKNLVLNPTVGSSTGSYGFNQQGARVLLGDRTRRDSEGRALEHFGPESEARRQVYIENINIITPAVLGENVEEVVFAAIRGGIERGFNVDFGDD